jgi:hypothetical protein
MDDAGMDDADMDDADMDDADIDDADLGGDGTGVDDPMSLRSRLGMWQYRIAAVIAAGDNVAVCGRFPRPEPMAPMGTCGAAVTQRHSRDGAADHSSAPRTKVTGTPGAFRR